VVAAPVVAERVEPSNLPDLPDFIIDESRTASQCTLVPEEEVRQLEESSKQAVPDGGVASASKDKDSPCSAGRSPEFTMRAFGQTLPKTKSQESLPTAKIESVEAAGDRIRQRIDELDRETPHSSEVLLPATPGRKSLGAISTPASCRRELFFSPSSSSRTNLVAPQIQVMQSSLTSVQMQVCRQSSVVPGIARVGQSLAPANGFAKVAQPMQPARMPIATAAMPRPQQYWPSFLPKQTRVAQGSLPIPLQQ